MNYETEFEAAHAARHALHRLLNCDIPWDALNPATQETVEHCRHVLASPIRKPTPQVSRSTVWLLAFATIASTAFLIVQILKFL